VDEMCGNAGVLLERAAAGMMRWLNLGRLLAVEPRRKGVHRASGC